MQKPIVLGLGATGMSVVRHLQGEVAMIMDDRAEPPGLAELRAAYPEIAVGPYDAAQVAAAASVVVSPGVSPHQPWLAPLVAATPTKFVSDIDLFVAAGGAVPIVGVTGTNGKSTVVSLLGHIAAELGVDAGVGGNLGPPALDVLAPERQVYLLELSSFQLAWTQYLPLKSAVVLNVGVDHLDWHRDLDDYRASKQRIYRQCQYPVSRDEASLGYALQRDATLLFSVITHAGEAWLAMGGQALLPVADLPMRGRHQVENVLAALALGVALDWPVAAMVAALASFKGLAHRCVTVGEVNGVEWVNDSKATNVMAACAALDSMDRPVMLLAGGQAKESDFSALAELAASKARMVVCFGQDRRLLAEACAAVEVAHTVVETMQQAMQLAAEHAEPGDVVLLAPACASFDEFANYQARGQAFAEFCQRQ